MKATNTRKSWRTAFGPPPDAPKPLVRGCDHPGCPHQGEYRAPQARDRLNDYYWFCLDHVRAYNASWNYYAGMDPETIERELRKDTTWQRPTWPLGAKGNGRRFVFNVHDPFDFFPADADAEEAKRRTRPPTPEEQAMKELDLAGPLTMEQLKARYKELVKRHHPDANNGDKGAEERFKRINHAYNTLKASLNA